MSQLTQGNIRAATVSGTLPHSLHLPQLSSSTVSVQSTSNAITNVVASVRQPVSTVLATAASVLSNRNVNSLQQSQSFQLQQVSATPTIQQLQQPLIALAQGQTIQVQQPQTIQLHGPKIVQQQTSTTQPDLPTIADLHKEDRDQQRNPETSVGIETQQKQEGLKSAEPEPMDVDSIVETVKQDDAPLSGTHEASIPLSQAITPLTLQLSAPVLAPTGPALHPPTTAQVIASQASTQLTQTHIITPKLSVPLTLTPKITQSPTTQQQQSIVLPARLMKKKNLILILKQLILNFNFISFS